MNEERDISYGCYLHAVAVQSLSRVQLFVTPWTEACKAFLSLLVSWSLSKFMFIASVMPSSHCVFWSPLLLLPSIFPSFRVFSNESALSSGCHSIGALASASLIPMNIQGWFPLGLTGLISLLSKGLSRVISRPWKAIIGSVPPKWGNEPRKLKM